MARQLVARTRANNEWTEAKFFSFLRSNIRKTSQKWPPIARLALEAARREYKGPNKLQKWEYRCAGCTKWFKRTEVQVDHIIPCGSLKCFEDLVGFYERTFVEVEGLRVLCTECHGERRKE